jgi:hypothetical protein
MLLTATDISESMAAIRIIAEIGVDMTACLSCSK